jgi:hypothetical protein
MILPKIRDPRFVTLRRGGTLTDSDHRLLAPWAASCAAHVLDFFESARPQDPRPRQAIEHARAWVRSEVKMMQARAVAGHAMGAARDLRGAARGTVKPRPLGYSSADGSVTSSRRRFASSYSTTSGCEMTSAGWCLTAERNAVGRKVA